MVGSGNSEKRMKDSHNLSTQLAFYFLYWVPSSLFICVDVQCGTEGGLSFFTLFLALRTVPVCLKKCTISHFSCSLDFAEVGKLIKRRRCESA